MEEEIFAVLGNGQEEVRFIRRNVVGGGSQECKAPLSLTAKEPV